MGLLVERLKACKELDEIVICTEDEAISELADAHGIVGVLLEGGRSGDVLGMLAATSNERELTTTVHIPGNQPLVDPAIVDHLVKTMIKSPAHVVSCEKPHGSNVTVFTRFMLNQLVKRVHGMSQNPMEALEPKPLGARIAKLKASETRFRFDVQEPRDVSFIRALVERCGPMAGLKAYTQAAELPEFKDLVVLDDLILEVLGAIGEV
jgi:spore coat polysaccharide biosynthesis protein SpsF (cytidylyltransferase family)